jgi:7-cyano-7-deazaguanine synthase
VGRTEAAKNARAGAGTSAPAQAGKGANPEASPGSNTGSEPGNQTGALVLFSGGQDSATCLAWALERYDHVETLGFDYGQRHRIELDCRAGFRESLARRFPAWGARLGDDHMLDLSVLGALGDTAMTREIRIEALANGLPNTFVPGRNLMFLTLAAALAYRRGLKMLVGGMCETDFSGYPDCRDDTMKALQVALNLGMDRRFVVETPLMWLDKADTWRLAQHLGGDVLVELVRVETHTCYLGERSELHAWGFGCGQCPACELRKRGYERFTTGSASAAPQTSLEGGT